METFSHTFGLFLSANTQSLPAASAPRRSLAGVLTKYRVLGPELPPSHIPHFNHTKVHLLRPWLSLVLQPASYTQAASVVKADNITVKKYRRLNVNIE